MSRLQESYRKNMVKNLTGELGLTNQMAAPRLVKIVINVGTGQTKTNPKFQDAAAETIRVITGQSPAKRTAKKAISGFKIREGDQIGLVVTLRGKRMYDFADKLANIVLPRMRDFRGLDPKAFGKSGNFTLGLAEQIIFPEITHEKAEILHGMSITFVTTANDAKGGQALLKALGFPFKKDESEKGLNG